MGQSHAQDTVGRDMRVMREKLVMCRQPAQRLAVWATWPQFSTVCRGCSWLGGKEGRRGLGKSFSFDGLALEAPENQGQNVEILGDQG